MSELIIRSIAEDDVFALFIYLQLRGSNMACSYLDL